MSISWSRVVQVESLTVASPLPPVCPLLSVQCLGMGTMNSILSFILQPFITLILSRDDDSGIDILYPLSLFFAIGIWLVYDRYQKMHNSPVPFSIVTPHVW